MLRSKTVCPICTDCIKYPSNDRVQKFLLIVLSYDIYVLNQLNKHTVVELQHVSYENRLAKSKSHKRRHGKNIFSCVMSQR